MADTFTRSGVKDAIAENGIKGVSGSTKWNDLRDSCQQVVSRTQLRLYVRVTSHDVQVPRAYYLLAVHLGFRKSGMRGLEFYFDRLPRSVRINK